MLVCAARVRAPPQVHAAKEDEVAALRRQVAHLTSESAERARQLEEAEAERSELASLKEAHAALVASEAEARARLAALEESASGRGEENKQLIERLLAEQRVCSRAPPRLAS